MHTAQLIKAINLACRILNQYIIHPENGISIGLKIYRLNSKEICGFFGKGKNPSIGLKISQNH